MDQICLHPSRSWRHCGVRSGWWRQECLSECHIHLKYMSGMATKIFLLCTLCIGYRLNMAKYARPRSLSGKADRACEVCFRSKTEGGHISPYSVYNLFITYFTHEFIFCKLSYCNLKYLKCSTFFALRLIRLEKIAESFCYQNNKQTLRENDVYILASKDHL